MQVYKYQAKFFKYISNTHTRHCASNLRFQESRPRAIQFTQMINDFWSVVERLFQTAIRSVLSQKLYVFRIATTRAIPVPCGRSLFSPLLSSNVLSSPSLPLLHNIPFLSSPSPLLPSPFPFSSCPLSSGVEAGVGESSPENFLISTVL